MKRIGDVMKHISIPIGPDKSGFVTPEPAVACPKCQDAGFVRMNVQPSHPMFGSLVPCACKLREEEDQRRRDLLEMSNLNMLDRFTFQSFEPDEAGTSDAYEQAMAFAKSPDGWLFLHGRCGVGKTHLAVAIASLYMELHDQGVLFQVVPDLLDQLRATFDPSNGVAYDDRFEQIRDAPLLILDDLGTENTTPWAREKLYQIFNRRYNDRAPTVITSNQDLSKIDERIASRILDTHLTKDIFIDAEDYRRRGRPDYVRGRRR